MVLESGPMRMDNARTVGLWGGIGLWLACACPAMAGEVRAIDLATGATGTRAEIQLQGSGEYKTISLAGPDRLVVDLPASSAGKGLKLPAASGVVKAVRTGQPTPDTLRIVFDLSGPITALRPRMEKDGQASRLVIEWPGDGPAPKAATATAATASAPPAQVGASQPSAAQATAALVSGVAGQAVQTARPVETPPAETSPSPAAILNGQSTAAQVPSAASPAGADAPKYTIATGRPAAVTNSQAAGAGAATVAAAEATPATPQPSVESVVPAPTRSLAEVRMRAGMRPLVVAIDAGHGGQDSGAIGPTGKYEKNVTLAIARELARQVDATPGLKAYLVRDGDYFIPLNQRAVKARSARADMFVSIHADAAENRSANGSSVYVLSLKGASSQRARWLADKENSSDLVGGVALQRVDNTLSSVLIDLAQSGHMRASEDAASHVLDGLKDIGNNHKPHIERANFAVLRTSDMPAMLVETAFISNYDEEKRLTDPRFQRKIAGAVLEGVQTYFTRQPPPGTLFAARAQAAQAQPAAGSLGTAGAGAP